VRGTELHGAILQGSSFFFPVSFFSPSEDGEVRLRREGTLIESYRYDLERAKNKLNCTVQLSTNKKKAGPLGPAF
jgi:hypothetical protein